MIYTIERPPSRWYGPCVLKCGYTWSQVMAGLGMRSRFICVSLYALEEAVQGLPIALPSFSQPLSIHRNQHLSTWGLYRVLGMFEILYGLTVDRHLFPWMHNGWASLWAGAPWPPPQPCGHHADMGRQSRCELLAVMLSPL